MTEIRKRLQRAVVCVQSTDEEVARAMVHVRSRIGWSCDLQSEANSNARAVDTAQREVVDAVHETCSSSQSEEDFLDSR